MPNRNLSTLLLSGLLALAIPTAALAQIGGPGAPPTTSPVKLFHPAPPLPSYEVATIKKADPGAQRHMMMMPIGGIPSSGITTRGYILNAYGGSSQSQIIGGPAWLGTDSYVFKAKPSDDLRDAMQKLTPQERADQTRMMEQSLLADRFQLKAHFETRELPLIELTPAKGGLKMKSVPAPAPFGPGMLPPPPPPRPTADGGMPKITADSIRPGMVMMQSSGGASTLYANATTMSTIINLLRNTPDVNGRPVLDKTGFTDHFDVMDLEWSTLTSAGLNPGSDIDAPSLPAALEQKLGIKLNETKGPVEVLVIDSIERPSEN